MLNDISQTQKKDWYTPEYSHSYTETKRAIMKEENCNQMMLAEVTEKLVNKYKISVRTISRILQNIRVTMLKTITMFQNILKAFVYF